MNVGECFNKFCLGTEKYNQYVIGSNEDWRELIGYHSLLISSINNFSEMNLTGDDYKFKIKFVHVITILCSMYLYNKPIMTEHICEEDLLLSFNKIDVSNSFNSYDNMKTIVTHFSKYIVNPNPIDLMIMLYAGSQFMRCDYETILQSGSYIFE